MIPAESPIVGLSQYPLTQLQTLEAIAFNRRHFDRRSTMIFQMTVGTEINGVFSPQTAQAVAAYQMANGLAGDGIVGLSTLDLMIRDRAAAGLPEQAIQLVTDYGDTDTGRDTLSLYYQPDLTAPWSLSIESRYLRVIQVGPDAFDTAAGLRQAIGDALQEAVPAYVTTNHRPVRLSLDQVVEAIHYNEMRFVDQRSILVIQGLVGAAARPGFDAATVERIAAFQVQHDSPVNGKIEEETLQAMVQTLIERAEFNAAIRLIIDYYDMVDRRGLLDIHYDPAIDSNAKTTGAVPGPSLVRLGAVAFQGSFPALVHTIAHEIEHVRQRVAGIISPNIREFLGEAVEVISRGMPEERLPRFANDARRALRYWRRMTEAERRLYWLHFEVVRSKVLERFRATAVNDRPVLEAAVADYVAEVEPGREPAGSRSAAVSP